MNSYKTVNAAYYLAGRDQQEAVRFGRVWEHVQGIKGRAVAAVDWRGRSYPSGTQLPEGLSRKEDSEYIRFREEQARRYPVTPNRKEGEHNPIRVSGLNEHQQAVLTAEEKHRFAEYNRKDVELTFTQEEVRQSYANTSYLSMPKGQTARYIVTAMSHETHGLVYYVQDRAGRRVTVYTLSGDVAYVWAAIREIAAQGRNPIALDYNKENTGDYLSDITPAQARALAGRMGYTV